MTIETKFTDKNPTPEEWREIISRNDAKEFMNTFGDLHLAEIYVNSIDKEIEGLKHRYDDPNLFIELSKKLEDKKNAKKSLDNYCEKLIDKVLEYTPSVDSNLKEQVYDENSLHDLEFLARGSSYDLSLCDHPPRLLDMIGYKIRSKIQKRLGVEPKSDAYDLGW